MPQVAIAVAASWATATAAEYAAFTLLAGATGSAVIGAVAGLAVTAIGSKLLGESGAALGSQAINGTIRQAAASRRLIYGRVKTGGVLAYIGQNDSDRAYMVVALGEGPIQGIDEVFFIGDDLSTADQFSGLVTIHRFLGSTSQAASTTLAAALPTEWTADHRLRGVAYALVSYKFDRNAFSSGLILPTFMVSGRKVYDPRTGTMGWSDNPALCVLDYLRSKYSVACPASMIDFDSFSAAANVCDEVITSADPANVVGGVPGRVKRYTLNGVFEAGSSPVPIIEAMEAACAGKLVFTQGKYRFYAGAYRAPVGTITAEFLRAAPTLRAYPSRQQRVNIARGTYREPRQGWQDTDFQPQVLSAEVVAEAGEIVQNFSFQATTNGATAQRLARIAMRRARAQTPLVLQCNWAALQWRLWDTVTVDLPEIHETGRTWCIVAYSFAEGGGIDLTLLPDEAAHYAWDAATDEVLVKDAPVPNFNREPPAIVGLSSTGVAESTGSEALRYLLTATWDAVGWAKLKHYEVRWKRSTESTYVLSAVVTAPGWQTSDVQPAATYNIEVRAVGLDDTTGPWAAASQPPITTDTTPPSPPSSASVSGAGAHVVTWVCPSNADFRRVNVYTVSGPGLGSPSLIDVVFGVPGGANQRDYARAADTHYALSAVDMVGNESGLVYAGVGWSAPPDGGA